MQRKTSAEEVITEKVSKHHPRVLIWNPSLELEGAPLPPDFFIRDFQKGKADNVANALEHPLLLPQDMVDMRTLKKHKMFLTLKRDLAMVGLSIHYLY